MPTIWGTTLFNIRPGQPFTISPCGEDLFVKIELDVGGDKITCFSYYGRCLTLKDPDTPVYPQTITNTLEWRPYAPRQ